MAVSINGGTPSSHPFSRGFSLKKPSSSGTPLLGNPQINPIDRLASLYHLGPWLTESSGRQLPEAFDHFDCLRGRYRVPLVHDQQHLWRGRGGQLLVVPQGVMRVEISKRYLWDFND